jgi:hypothetical protein
MHSAPTVGPVGESAFIVASERTKRPSILVGRICEKTIGRLNSSNRQPSVVDFSGCVIDASEQGRKLVVRLATSPNQAFPSDTILYLDSLL